MSVWKKTVKPAGNLADIGAPLRTIATRRALNQITLPGSSKGFVAPKPNYVAKPAIFTKCPSSPTYGRHQVQPMERVPRLFQAFPLGINPETGLPWGEE